MFFLYQFCGATFFFEITNYPGKNNNFWWARGCLFSISAATRKGQHKKFQQRTVMRYVWAGVFHSAFSRVNRLPGERRASKSAFPADRQCYYRRREAIKKRIKSSIWSDFSVCGRGARNALTAYMHIRRRKTSERERVTSPRGLQTQQQQARGRVKIHSFIFIYSHSRGVHPSPTAIHPRLALVFGFLLFCE